MKTENSINRKNATYPLNGKEAPAWLKWSIAIPPILLMLTITLVTAISSNFSSVILKSMNAIQNMAIMTLVYSLANAFSAPIGGKLGDIYGRKKVALVSILLVAGVLIGCAFATSFWPFLVLWGILGFAFGLIATLHFGMVADAFDRETTIMMQQMCSSANAVAAVIGSFAIGRIMQNFSCKPVFMAVAIALLIVEVLIIFLYPNIEVQNKNTKIDFMGIIFMMLGLGPVCVLLTIGGKQVQWFSVASIIMLIVSVVFIAVFYKYEQKVEQPLIDFKMFKISMFTLVVFLPMLNKLQYPIGQYSRLYGLNVLGFPASTIGYLSLVVIIPAVLSPIIGKWLSKTMKFTTAYLVSACCLLLHVLGMIFFVNENTSFIVLMILLGLGNLATCFCTPVSVNHVTVLVQPEQRGVALGVHSIVQYIANVVFIAVAGFIFNNFNANVAEAFRYICYFCLVLASLYMLVVALISKKKSN